MNGNHTLRIDYALIADEPASAIVLPVVATDRPEVGGDDGRLATSRLRGLRGRGLAVSPGRRRT